MPLISQKDSWLDFFARRDHIVNESFFKEIPLDCDDRTTIIHDLQGFMNRYSGIFLIHGDANDAEWHSKLCKREPELDR